MFVPLSALPLAVELIVAADGVPKLDVTPSCQGAATSGYIATTEDRLKSCIDSEQRTREKLDKNWPNFAPGRPRRLRGLDQGFEPTYSELATCLEMKRDLEDHQAAPRRDVRAGRAPVRRRKSTRSPLTEVQLLEEVVALVVDHDEGREVHHLDPPDRLHAELGIFEHSTFLMQCSARFAAAPPIEPR